MLPAALVFAVSCVPAATPLRTAVVVLTQPAAEAPIEEASFATVVTQEVMRLAGHDTSQTRYAKKTTGCGLDSFLAFGVDLGLCGQAPLSANLDRALVFELDLDRGVPVVRAAYLNLRQPARRARLEVAVAADGTRTSVARAVFARLFSSYSEVRVAADAGSYLFIDGQWLGEASDRRGLLAAPGFHSVELRRGGERRRVEDIYVAAGERRVIDADRFGLMLATR